MMVSPKSIDQHLRKTLKERERRSKLESFEALEQMAKTDTTIEELLKEDKKPFTKPILFKEQSRLTD